MQTEAHLEDADGFYNGLVQAHEGLSEQQSFEFNARLIFLLANQIGDAAVLAECLEAAAPLVTLSAAPEVVSEVMPEVAPEAAPGDDSRSR